MVWWTARAAAAHVHRCAMLATTWYTPHTPDSSVTAALVYPGMSCWYMLTAHGRSCIRCSLLGGAEQSHQIGPPALVCKSKEGLPGGQQSYSAALLHICLGHSSQYSVAPKCCPVIIVLLDHVVVFVVWCYMKQQHMHGSHLSLVSACITSWCLGL